MVEFSPEEGTARFLEMALKFGVRLLMDLLFLFLLLRLIYYRKYKHGELFFTYSSFNLVIFIVCFLMNRMDISLGAAFGLFAVFSMLRYRTEDLSVKDMTYLFLSISIGLITSVSKIKDTSFVYEHLFVFSVLTIVLLITALYESNYLFRNEFSKNLQYENLELIKASRRIELMEDLKLRTGLPIHRVTVGKIDFTKSTAQVKIYYYKENKT